MRYLLIEFESSIIEHFLSITDTPCHATTNVGHIEHYKDNQHGTLLVDVSLHRCLRNDVFCVGLEI